jgi:hypothetical protein
MLASCKTINTMMHQIQNAKKLGLWPLGVSTILYTKKWSSHSLRLINKGKKHLVREQEKENNNKKSKSKQKTIPKSSKPILGNLKRRTQVKLAPKPITNSTKQVVLKNYGYCLHNAWNVYDFIIKLTSIKLGNLSSEQLWNETLFLICWLLDINAHTWEFPSTTWDQGQIHLAFKLLPTLLNSRSILVILFELGWGHYMMSCLFTKTSKAFL